MKRWQSPPESSSLSESYIWWVWQLKWGNLFLGPTALWNTDWNIIWFLKKPFYIRRKPSKGRDIFSHIRFLWCIFAYWCNTFRWEQKAQHILADCIGRVTMFFLQLFDLLSLVDTIALICYMHELKSEISQLKTASYFHEKNQSWILPDEIFLWCALNAFFSTILIPGEITIIHLYVFNPSFDLFLRGSGFIYDVLNIQIDSVCCEIYYIAAFYDSCDEYVFDINW